MNFPRDWHVEKPGFTCHIVPLIAYDGLNRALACICCVLSGMIWQKNLGCAIVHDLAEKLANLVPKGFVIVSLTFFSITGYLTLRDGSKTMESMDSPSALVTSDESSHTTLSETANINTSHVTNGTSGVNPSTLSFCPIYSVSYIH